MNTYASMVIRKRTWSQVNQFNEDGNQKLPCLLQQKMSDEMPQIAVFSRGGMKPYSEKLKGNTEMPRPKWTAATLILGMWNFMQPFIPYLAHCTAPVRELLKKKTGFYWDENTNTTLQKLKSFISKAHGTPLQCYQRYLCITFWSDTSKHSLSTCLLQHGKSIALAGNSLMDIETKYAKIEWKLLAIVHASDCFHTDLFGCSFTIERNHKPLEMIPLKTIIIVLPHQQRILLTLQQYDATIR